MKKLFLLFLFCFGISTFSFSQATGKGSEKSGGFFSRLFHKEQKPHGQMRHFDKRRKDPNIKHNGTSYNKSDSKNKVDGDGFGTATQEKRRRGRKTGVK